jgi:hypothetical protein
MPVDNHGYALIERIGRRANYPESHIQSQCDRARDAGAPLDAVYEQDGQWISASEITDLSLRVTLDLPALPGVTVDPAKLMARQVDAAGTIHQVAANAPGTPCIGTVTVIDGWWTAHPVGERAPLAPRFTTMREAADALAARVPAGAVWHRSGVGWVNAEGITRPSTRVEQGLPILTHAQINAASQQYAWPIAEVSELLPPSLHEMAEAGHNPNLAPLAGRPAVFGLASVWWLSPRLPQQPEGRALRHQAARPDQTSSATTACPQCSRDQTQGHEITCEVFATARHATTLMFAPVHNDGVIDWMAMGSPELGAIDEDVEQHALALWSLLLALPYRNIPPGQLAGTQRVGQADVFATSVLDPASTRHDIYLHDANITVEQIDGHTVVRVRANDPDAPLRVVVENHVVYDGD